MWLLTESTHRVAGPYLDCQRLLTLGVNGLIAYTRDMQTQNPDASTTPYYEATIGALELFRDGVSGILNGIRIH